MNLKFAKKRFKGDPDAEKCSLEVVSTCKLTGTFDGFFVRISDSDLMRQMNEVGHFGTKMKCFWSCLLEEAFFLKYALQCLSIFSENGTEIDDFNVWQRFCDCQSNFVQNYATYHYFRAKNWIVKSAFKYGADFLLYKKGPQFYHASFIVLIEVVNKSNGRRNNQRCANDFSVNSIIGLCRLAEANGKDLLICQVIWPNDLEAAKAKITSSILCNLEINEVLVQRWLAEKERNS